MYADEPLATTGAEPMQFPQLNVCAVHEAGAVHVDDVNDNVPLLHPYVALPILPFVDETVVVAPEPIAPTVAEHVALFVQLLLADEQPAGAQVDPDCNVHVPLLHIYVALPG